MDANQVILRDHREVERLFKALERGGAQADDPARRRELVRQLVRELSVHATVEEQLVYPALRRAGADERVLDALEEHHAAKVTLWELERLPASSERFLPKVRLLAESVRRHVEEEERELLPLLESTFEAGPRRELGEAFERARRAAPTRPHPGAPDEPPANIVAGAFAALYDRSRDALRGAVDVLRAVAAQATRRTLEGLTGVAESAQRWSRGAIDEAVEQGRAAVQDASARGREVMEEAREATGRLQVRGAEAARETGRSSRAVARAARKGTRTAAREYRAGRRGGARKRRR